MKQYTIVTKIRRKPSFNTRASILVNERAAIHIEDDDMLPFFCKINHYRVNLLGTSLWQMNITEGLSTHPEGGNKCFQCMTRMKDWYGADQYTLWLHHLIQDGTHKSFLPANTNCHAHKQRDMCMGDANYYCNVSPVLCVTRCHRHIISFYWSLSQKVHQANLWAHTLKKNTSR